MISGAGDIELIGSNLYAFISTPDDVLRELRTFIQALR
jgi:hypothetical protein